MTIIVKPVGASCSRFKFCLSQANYYNDRTNKSSKTSIIMLLAEVRIKRNNINREVLKKRNK
ncbi:MAG: hypothetical protein F6K54_38630 [Okeania sp. SIO3B5]|uniref:hypothetical protein n=1 Tax=Okeania sp. SIO3B5 TaxID=2607811 RepID=UPI001401B976|nr:hypothetical protein [Okeania sp. SIO3B5]NEO58452.1 hypothetical protein [Okeania sp. SIO3B5]